MQIQTKEEIINALNLSISNFNNFISPLNKEQFEHSPEGKWNAGQNLDHLIRAIKPLQLAYSVPKLFLKWKFGKSNRPSKTYDQLVEKYKTKLAGGGRATGPFVPPAIQFQDKDSLLKTYEQEKLKFIQKIRRQSEADLDKYILPHPLLGKLTLREMLFFTIYHNEHHLQLLKQRPMFIQAHQSS
jgi:hypothetical protein